FPCGSFFDTMRDMSMENPFIKKHGTSDYDKVIDESKQQLDKKIHNLNQQAINESLQNDFLDTSDDFSTSETEAIQKDIDEITALKDSLEKKNHSSLN